MTTYNGKPAPPPELPLPRYGAHEMQTCNMDERTNEEKLRDKIAELENDIAILRMCHAETIDKLIAANLDRSHMKMALQDVVDKWASQFERNGHYEPEWVKNARLALSR